MKTGLTYSRAHELLCYDPATGLLTRRSKSSNSVKVGEIAGCRHPTKGYISVYVDGVRYKAHRVAWLMHYGHWPSGQIDHINCVPDDNRICNLRVVTNSVNAENKVRPVTGNTSGLLGVSWMSNAKKWRAQICVNKQVKYLGLFAEKEAAHRAYIEAKRSLHSGCTI